jgi:urease accessory protein UreF
MMVGIKNAPGSPAELLGDPHPLLERLGAADDLAVGSALSHHELGLVNDLPSLQRFLDTYKSQLLESVELPAIVAAYQHASRGEVRELIALDKRLASEPALRHFAAASFRVGQRQLGKLRPMRDHRVVQRYLAAIEAGEASGWHTVVYGVALATFSLPLRQGLQNYGEQTFRGFVSSAAASLRLTEVAADNLIALQSSSLPALVSQVLEPVRSLSIS